MSDMEAGGACFLHCGIKCGSLPVVITAIVVSTGIMLIDLFLFVRGIFAAAPLQKLLQDQKV